MTDIDLMSEAQVSIMTTAAIILWVVVAWSWHKQSQRNRDN